MSDCRKMLYDSGYTKILKGDNSTVTLNLDYLIKTNSF